MASTSASEAAPATAAVPPPLRLAVSHETRCDYPAPVALAHHVAHLRPLHDAHQQLLRHSLQIDPAPQPPADWQRDSSDPWGNVQRHFTLVREHARLRVLSESELRVSARFAALEAGAGPAWDVLVAGLRYRAGGAFEPAVEFAQPSPYVPRLAALRDWGAAEFVPGRPAAELALALMRRVHAEFEYRSGGTDVDTPLARVLAQRHGVCQDFAHLLCGALRAHGLPARYVSGYLLTTPPGGGAPLLGADASHAWVQAWCPGTPGVPADGWLDLDPTNACVPERGHVRLAVGRDYGDVAPLRGVIRGGGGRHALHVAVQTTRLADGETADAGPAAC